MKTRIEVFRRGIRRRWYFAFIAEGGRIVAESSPYQTRAEAIAAVNFIRREFVDAVIVDR